uniref:RING-type domain-containing protein n=1 Tax=Amphimedon queenslandica TaxID=400682 RepID=A0A1X7TM88_AMPQE
MAENTSPAITMTCEVCSEYYTDPLVLPCLHSFCKKCLIKAKEKQGSADTSLKCPTCDTSVNLPDGKIEGLTQNLWFEHKSKEASIKKKIHSREPILYYIDVGEAARKALKESVTSCDGVIPPVTEAIANGEKMLEQIATRKEEVRQDIKKTFEELKAALDKRCNDLLMETEEIAIAKKNSVKKQLDGFRKLIKQVSHGRHLASSVSERTDPGEVLSVKKLISNQLEECIEEYKELPLEIEENEAILTSLDTTVMSNEIGKYGGVFKVDADFYSVNSGQAIPLGTEQKERKFKLTTNIPVPLDKALQHIHTSFIKSDGNKEEGRVDIHVVKDNNTAIVSCTPQSIGGYELSVTIRGHHIKGSPYQLSVKASRDYTTLAYQRSFNVGNTCGVAVHTNGEVFASSHYGGFVQVFSEDGTALRKIGSKGNGNGQFQCAWGLLLVGDRLYVSDLNLHCVQYFSATTGQYIGQFGSKGNENRQFSTPRGMSTDGKGNILVADYSNKRVQVFKEDGIAIDDEGYVFVSNNNGCLHVLSPDRKQVIKSISLAEIYGIALDKDGYIYVAEYRNSRIMKY